VAESYPTTPARADAVEQGRAAAKKLAGKHYENFSVASILLPPDVRQDLLNIYAFCRLADDFADEAVGGVNRSDELDRWEVNLRRAGESTEVTDFQGDAGLFIALGETIRRRRLPLEPFFDLLTAFRLDLIKTRYESWEDLLDYARLSANPVGRLTLAVCGSTSEEQFALSDKICTALQLANHWQDVGDDFQRCRIYIPSEILREFNVGEEIIRDRRATPEFRRMTLYLVDRTRRMFDEGKLLLDLAPKSLRAQLYLYLGGGIAALKAIQARGGDVLTHRCRVRNRDRVLLAMKALGIYLTSKF